MHPLVIYAIVQFDQQERDRANETRRRANELIAAQARRTATPRASAPAVRPAAPAPSRQPSFPTAPAVIGCRP
jgi:hypothetical protein